MVVSDALQAAFDKKRKKWDISQKLKSLESQISPDFLKNFEVFRMRILDIVEETPESSSLVEWQLGLLENELHNASRRHEMKKAKTMIEYSS